MQRSRSGEASAGINSLGAAQPCESSSCSAPAAMPWEILGAPGHSWVSCLAGSAQLCPCRASASQCQCCTSQGLGRGALPWHCRSGDGGDPGGMQEWVQPKSLLLGALGNTCWRHSPKTCGETKFSLMTTADWSCVWPQITGLTPRQSHPWNM